MNTRTIQSVGGIIINAAIARHLSTEHFGTYFICLSVASLLATFILSGANTILLRNAASKSNKASFTDISHYAASLLITGIAICFMYFSKPVSKLLLTTGLFISSELRPAVIALSFSVAFQSIMHDYFRGLGKFRIASSVANYGALGSIGYGVISISIFSTLLPILLLFNIKLSLTNLIWTASATGTIVVFTVWYIERVRVSKLSLEENTCKSIPHKKGERVALLSTAILAIVLNQMDIYTVSAHFSASNVAIYGAAQRLSLLVLLPLMIITAFFQPLSARLYSSGNIKMLADVSRAFTSILLFCGMCALFIFICTGPFIMELAYGPLYKSGATILIIKAAGSVALLVTGLSNAVFTTTGNERLLVLVGSIGIFMYFICFSLFPVMSINQIALLHSCTLAFMSLLYIVISRKVVKIDISPSLSPTFILKVMKMSFSSKSELEIGRRT